MPESVSPSIRLSVDIILFIYCAIITKTHILNVSGFECTYTRACVGASLLIPQGFTHYMRDDSALALLAMLHVSRHPFLARSQSWRCRGGVVRLVGRLGGGRAARRADGL